VELRYKQTMFDGGTKYSPILIPISMTSANGAAVNTYIKIPVDARIIRAEGFAIGTGSTVYVTIKQYYADFPEKMNDYCEQMSEAELLTAGVIVTACSANNALLKLTPVPGATPAIIQAVYDTNFLVAYTGTLYARANGSLETDDVLQISVAPSNAAIPYQINLYIASNEG